MPTPKNIVGAMVVDKDGNKQTIMNMSNARRKTYAQYQQMSEAQRKGVVIVEDYPIPEQSDSVSVTADGVKNWQTLLNELNSLVDRDKICFSTCLSADGHIFRLVSNGAALYFDAMNNLSSGAYNLCIKLSSNSTYTTWELKSSGNNYVDNSTTGVPTTGAVITLIYDYYKTLDIHTEYLAKNCILTGGGNVEDELDEVNDKVDKIVTVGSAWYAATFNDYIVVDKYFAPLNALPIHDTATLLAVNLLGHGDVALSDFTLGESQDGNLRQSYIYTTNSSYAGKSLSVKISLA